VRLADVDQMKFLAGVKGSGYDPRSHPQPSEDLG
jgi:hypothetical protein